MNISANDEFSDTGEAMITVRDVMRRISGRDLIARERFVAEFTARDYGNRSLFLDDPGYVFDELVRLKYLEKRSERIFNSINEDQYCMTVLGGAFANASAARPVKRATAEKVLAEFMDRVRTVNADPYSVWTVQKVVLFGSMLNELKETVGDVDLAVLYRNHHDRRDDAEQTGHLKYKDWTMTPVDPAGQYKFEADIKRFLRSRSRTLSVGSLGSGLQEDGTICGLPAGSTPHRVIFEAD
ncbi:nucleotidyltransferase domain-containing protein [Nocardia sp. NPDC050630]|uniref:nucleotidyltransferase domain-containing protein n=1 Tax=Nocardia sp. NPDC050630 TaxID=3364321 RepID=UPI0037BACF03